jgi:hypothetical protein
MTFSEFVTSVRQNVFPEGYAEEMDTRHRSLVVDALIDIQRKVLCKQVDHKSVFNYDDTIFNCGSTVVDAPVGYINKIYTIINDNWCDKVFYTPKDQAFIDCKSDMVKACGPTFPYADNYTNPHPDGYGDYYPYEGWDSSCRALSGWVALYRSRLSLFPAILSTEKVIVEWDGVQREWGDSDEVTFDRTVQQAVEWSLKSISGGFEDFDTTQYAAAKAEYQNAIAEMILECREQNRLPGQTSCFSNCYGR